MGFRRPPMPHQYTRQFRLSLSMITLAGLFAVCYPPTLGAQTGKGTITGRAADNEGAVSFKGL
jgi:hypothetical protein